MNALGLGLVVLVTMIVVAAHFVSSSSSPAVHEYQGTTYVEGVCYVDDVGVLWCSERI